ncbi:MAG: MobC family plasmid mobilization relaxosome protein [Pseudomonadota bacterium]|nr:MobC family plasmid mobilization relaxosome protein [Pseudomonadota bacterium]
MTDFQKRDKSIKIRVSEDELSRLKENAAGRQLASWLRDVGLYKKTKRLNPPPPVSSDLLRQLAAIGNNINQIAKQVNTSETAASDAIRIIVELDAIQKELSILRQVHARKD